MSADGKMDVASINNNILGLWEKYSDVMKNNSPSDESIWPRWPGLYNELNLDAVLFVGLNPSFVEKQMEERIKEGNDELGVELDINDLKWEGYRKDVEKFLQWERSYAKYGKDPEDPDAGYSYFKFMRNFAAENEVAWEHIDLFAIRVTSQKKLKEVLDIEKKKQNFVEEQIKIFFELLEELNPRIIVVENAYARDLLKGKHRGKNSKNLKNYSLKPKDKVCGSTGYQKIELNNEDVPIFFSGMLSGQRALDKGSRKRLKWHMKEALKTT